MLVHDNNDLIANCLTPTLLGHLPVLVLLPELLLCGLPCDLEEPLGLEPPPCDIELLLYLNEYNLILIN